MVYTTKVFFSILYFLTKAFVVYTTAERHSEEQGAARSRRKREEREKGGEGQRKEKKGGEKGERARTDRGGRKRKRGKEQRKGNRREGERQREREGRGGEGREEAKGRKIGGETHDDRAVCCSFPATNFGHLWGGGGNVFQERGNEGKAREGRGRGAGRRRLPDCGHDKYRKNIAFIHK